MLREDELEMQESADAASDEWGAYPAGIAGDDLYRVMRPVPEPDDAPGNFIRMTEAISAEDADFMVRSRVMVPLLLERLEEERERAESCYRVAVQTQQEALDHSKQLTTLREAAGMLLHAVNNHPERGAIESWGMVLIRARKVRETLPPIDLRCRPAPAATDSQGG